MNVGQSIPLLALAAVVFEGGVLSAEPTQTGAPDDAELLAKLEVQP